MTNDPHWARTVATLSILGADAGLLAGMIAQANNHDQPDRVGGIYFDSLRQKISDALMMMDDYQRQQATLSLSEPVDIAKHKIIWTDQS